MIRLCIALILTATVAWGQLTGKEPGLVAYYSLDTPYNPINLVDGTTNNALPMSANFKYWQTNVFYDNNDFVTVGADAFRGNNYSHMRIGPTGLLDGASAIGIGGWIRPISRSSLATDAQPFCYRSAWQGNHYKAFGLDNYGTNAVGLNLRAFAGAADPNFTTPAGPVAEFDTWTHVFVTYDTNSHALLLYKNGEIAASKIINTTTADLYRISQTGFVYLAYDTYSGVTKGFNGMIDEFSLWNRAPSPAEVRALAANKPLPVSGGNSYQQQNRYGASK